jgi:hypothetical protein
MISLAQPQTTKQLIQHLEAPRELNGHGGLPSLDYATEVGEITPAMIKSRHTAEHTDRDDLTHKHGIDF